MILHTYPAWFIYFVFILEFRRGKLFNIGLVTFLSLSVNIHVYTTQWLYAVYFLFPEAAKFKYATKIATLVIKIELSEVKEIL